jgi:hypothetical protein
LDVPRGTVLSQQAYEMLLAMGVCPHPPVRSLLRLCAMSGEPGRLAWQYLVKFRAPSYPAIRVRSARWGEVGM